MDEYLRNVANAEQKIEHGNNVFDDPNATSKERYDALKDVMDAVGKCLEQDGVLN